MKTLIRKPIWLLCIALTVISCSKNDNGENKQVHDGYVKMKKDGIVWQTDDSFQVKFVEQGLDVDENADAYNILLSAMQSGERETLQILLRLPFDKLDNPVGSYPIVSDATQSGMLPGMVEMNYYNKANSHIIFSSRTDPKDSPEVGTLTITKFEKGDGAFAQRQINLLKGTFSATLKGFEQGYKTGDVIEITDGEFEIPNALINLGK